MQLEVSNHYDELFAVLPVTHSCESVVKFMSQLVGPHFVCCLFYVKPKGGLLVAVVSELCIESTRGWCITSPGGFLGHYSM